jgi:phosphocarrier protein
MYSKEVIVRCESGLYNKQATYFVQKANDFGCNIWLESENRKMNAKSLLGVMSLSVVTGSVVTISADGADEIQAVDTLDALLQQDIA